MFFFFNLFQSVIEGFCRIRANNERAASKRIEKFRNSLPVFRSNEECVADINALKTIVVCNQNMDEIKEKLVATLEYRLNMIDQNVELDLLETFPYFFTDPSLVILRN